MINIKTINKYLTESKEKITVYVHNNKENNHEFADMCTNKKAQNAALYIGMEVKIEGDLDLETGRFFATKINGVKISKPVNV